MEYLASLATLVGMDGITAMIVEESNILHFAAIALMLVLLAARRAVSFFKSLLAGRRFANDRNPDRIFEQQRFSALKKCPGCSEELPLSALMCEACDYNFLSGMVGHGHKLLPSPEPRVHGMTKRNFA
ncbi:MAG: hypothetical protein ACREPG_04305 [Candidatus Binatia bacterium]